MDPQTNIETLCQDIFRRKRTTIGWGTGSVFRYFHGRLPVEPDFLIDNDPSMQGQSVRGIPVYSPDKLKELNPDDFAIIIYSSFLDQISEQIRTLGPYQFLPAGVVSGHEEIQLFLSKMELHAKYRPSRTPGKSNKAVVIQGPITSQFNVEIIKYYFHAHPNDHVILSTWESTNPLLLNQLENHADEIILNTPPPYSGYQNRNYQIASTLAGIKKAQELGATQVLKTRADIALLSEDILEACHSLRTLYNNDVCKQHGLQNRIIIPETYTRKYMLYHPGDLVMYGDTPDMLKFWSTPHDQRQFSLMDQEWKDKNIKQISIDAGPVESYLGRQFANTIDRPLNNTLEDSWDFLKDFFIVVDNSWFDIFWTKYPRLSSIETHNSVLRCISHCFWSKLYFDNVNMDKALSDIDINKTFWADFYGAIEKTA